MTRDKLIGEYHFDQADDGAERPGEDAAEHEGDKQRVLVVQQIVQGVLQPVS